MSRSWKRTTIAPQKASKAEKRHDKRKARGRWQGTSSQRGYFRRFFGSYRIEDKYAKYDRSPLLPDLYAYLDELRGGEPVSSRWKKWYVRK